MLGRERSKAKPAPGCRSPPAQKALSPAAVSTITRTSGSAWALRYPSRMPSITSLLIALRLSGRLMVIQKALSRFSCRTLELGSVIDVSLFCIRGGDGGWYALGRHVG